MLKQCLAMSPPRAAPVEGAAKGWRYQGVKRRLVHGRSPWDPSRSASELDGRRLRPGPASGNPAWIRSRGLGPAQGAPVMEHAFQPSDWPVVKQELAQRVREIREDLYGEHGGPLLAAALQVTFRTWYLYERGH